MQAQLALQMAALMQLITVAFIVGRKKVESLHLILHGRWLYASIIFAVTSNLRSRD